MKTETLLDLAEKWERDAIQNGARDGSKDAEYNNAAEDGRSACKLECAEDIRRLIAIIG
jgi:hypothetical protein